jgi:hypothetical protein
MKLTKTDAANWHMREGAHYNGGEVFFAYLHHCVEQPRLSRFDKYLRKDRSVTSTWRTDGQDMPSIEAAIEALNTPPTFDDDELAFLKKAPEEFTDIRKDIDWTVADQVRNKGAVEWERGKCRITDLGRSILAENTNG